MPEQITSEQPKAPLSGRERWVRLGLGATSFVATLALTYPLMQAAVGGEPCTTRPIEPPSYLAVPACYVARQVAQLWP